MASLRLKCSEMIAYCERAFQIIEKAVPPPTVVQFRDHPAYRFVERTPQQMILLKFARQVSGLYALDTLILNRHTQEAGVIMRTLDEIAEDTQCISLALINDAWGPIHDKMMSFFWQEEYDDISKPAKSLPRGMVDRKSIRAWTMRMGGITNTSLADEAGRTIHRSMSGYVHAAASHIMDLYTIFPPHFALKRMSDPVMLSGYVDLTVTYMYRGLVSSYAAVKAVTGHSTAQPFFEHIKLIEEELADHLFPQPPR